MSDPAVVVYGTVCLDRFVQVDRDGAPTSGAILEIPGGEAFNTATALAGWGVAVALTGTAIGGDPEGERLRSLLDTSPLGLPRRHLPDIADAVTPVCTIQVFPDGERRMRGRGFAQAVPPPRPEALFASRPIVAIDPNLGKAAVDAANAAAAAGCAIVAMDFPIDSPVTATSRIAVTSQERVSGDPAEVAREMVATGAKVGIVTCGPDGCIVADQTGVRAFPAFLVEGVVDTTGAGDMFRAGLCYGLVQGWSLARKIAFSSAAAALHTRVLGGASQIPVERVLRLGSGQE